ncbi:hypothetical protein [Paraburkholderia sp. CNPSo 3281]|nr:hypothetical protein [Paraburkholderia sp. CNPSo 3281]
MRTKTVTSFAAASLPLQTPMSIYLQANLPPATPGGSLEPPG